MAFAILPAGQLVLLCLALSTPLFIYGGFQLKRFADSGSWAALALSMTAYCAANLLFSQVIRHGLSAGYMASSVITSLALIFISVVYFQETMSAHKWLALICLICSSLFLSIPDAQAS